MELARRWAAGKPEPGSAAESLAFAEVYHCKGHSADAGEFYRRALKQEPKLADDVRSSAAFAADLAAWWSQHGDSHHAFVAVDAGSEVVGMAWLALLPRVPRPGAPDRRFADIQSVFVVPEHRGRGLGSALVETTAEHAVRLGAPRATVHSSREAVPLYEGLGFASSARLLQRPPE